MSTLPENAQLGLAMALSANPDLDTWARENELLVTAVTEQLARYAVPLTPAEYAVQLTRRLSEVRAIGPERARAALGLEPAK